MIPSGLADEIAQLDANQRSVVRHPGNVVALAGPGAGKTRTLVARAGYLLSERSSARQGVAAVTYTTKGADELSRRLRRIGLHPGRRLVSRTVHSFCLTEIIQPLARLTDDPKLSATAVIDDDAYLDLLERCLDDHGVLDKKVEYLRNKVTTIRRRAAASEDVSGFGDDWVAAVEHFEKRLGQGGLVDFEAMSGNALKILKSSDAIARLVAARLPHLIVDEYQDLGPVLHQIVLTLHRQGVMVSAVGDPDQTMYAHDGADPRYLRDLADRDDFLTVPMQVNYRSGPVIVAASQQILGEVRGYTAHPSQAHLGQLIPIEVGRSLGKHGRSAAEAAQARIAEGVSPEQIAILYPSRGPLLDALRAQIEQAGLPVVLERARKLPAGAIADLVAGCAARRLTGPLPEGAPNAVIGDVPTINELAARLRSLRHQVGQGRMHDALRPTGRDLVAVLDEAPRPSSEGEAASFVEQLIAATELDGLVSELPDSRDREALIGFRSATMGGDLTLAELAGGRIPGRVIVTTYHSAKGREFDTVILPGLCEGLVPRWQFNWSTKQWYVTEQAVTEARRNFYVAVTRAISTVVLVYGTGWVDGSRQRFHGRCRFVDDLMRGTT